MELLVHINKRLKSRNKVQLPVESLITQYLDPTATSVITVGRSLDAISVESF